MMNEQERKQASIRSDLWNLVHEVSNMGEEGMLLAQKLDVAISDIQEVQFRIGMDKGTEIGLQVTGTGRAILEHMNNEEVS